VVTLSLFRHAKSAWNTPAARDFERPLAPRGEKAAPAMGRFMADNGLEPEIVLCSTAARARQTLELALPAFRGEPEIRHADALYHAGPKAMLERVRALPGACAHAMIVGHNPGMQALAAELAGGGDANALAALAGKFPTAALAVIDFEAGWSDIKAGGGNLRLFMTPKQLP
jgi:phosphohistidine phosphatase